MKTKVFLTGATGVMGGHGLKELMARPEAYEVTVLARPGKKNEKKLAPYIAKGLNVIWGDLLDADAVRRGVSDADIVLHVGGMVSPAADWYPAKTIKTNVGAMELIIDAAMSRKEEVKVVYIGSVAQYGNYEAPHHWGQAGDPLSPALFDAYAYSKLEAERMLAESDLRYWVSLRQTGILHSDLLMKASDPIAFHVPIKGCLEWVTAEDSGRLLERVCRPEVPKSFWKKFYNIGGGAAYRMTNYEFEARLLKAMGCPPPEKVFDARWFATRNFHGFWYRDSDALEDILHFRSGTTPDEYFAQMKSELPWFFSLAPAAPAFVIKAFMGTVARKADLGPMWWIKKGIEPRINAAWGSLDAWKALPKWKDMDLSRPADTPEPARPTAPYTPESVKSIAGESGIEVLDCPELVEPDTELHLRCSHGHKYSLRARTLLEGGHRCSECVREKLEI